MKIHIYSVLENGMKNITIAFQFTVKITPTFKSRVLDAIEVRYLALFYHYVYTMYAWSKLD